MSRRARAGIASRLVNSTLREKTPLLIYIYILVQTVQEFARYFTSAEIA